MIEASGILLAVGAAGYLLILLLLMPFGAHRLRLIWLRLRRPERPAITEWHGELPRVTVQLPVYNEANVVSRLIDATCRLDYPRHLLEIQLLDDSTDETPEIAAPRIAAWRKKGVEIRHLRRTTRDGFKAGALAAGTEQASGDFLLVLDADFLPPPDLVRRLLPPFGDPDVGAVQAAWGHLNRGESWLTRAQGLFLDAHFAIEHEARYRSGLFFNFNGSGGIWRRRCLEESGGWRAETLTEDLDLSYRAQLAGWRFVYRDDVSVPGELPRRLRALELQQERWAQGGIQTAVRLLAPIWRSGLRRAVKLEATAHLLGHAVHPLTLLLGLALCAFGFLGRSSDFLPWWVHILALGLATVPFILFYGLAARLRGRSVGASAREILEAMTLGLGLGIPLSAAVLRGLAGVATPFHRTPKNGPRPRRFYRTRGNLAPAMLRGALGISLAAAAANLAASGLLSAVPFTGLFALGYLAATRETVRDATLETVH